MWYSPSDADAIVWQCFVWHDKVGILLLQGRPQGQASNALLIAILPVQPAALLKASGGFLPMFLLAFYHGSSERQSQNPVLIHSHHMRYNALPRLTMVPISPDVSFFLAPLMQPARLCDRCMAMQGQHCPHELDYRNITRTAAWPLTEITDAMYKIKEVNSLSPWMCMKGFHFHQIGYDWMHQTFLGTSRDLVASGILDWLIIRFCLNMYFVGPSKILKLSFYT